jgi:replication-associated recombination protein RarA
MSERNAFGDIKTAHGHPMPEASSSFQKSIRRSDVEAAMYWSSQMYLAGYGNYVWKRMSIMVSEDIGLAEPSLPATFFALRRMWDEQLKQKNDHPAQAQLFFVNAVLLLATAKKSRTVDNYRILFYEDPDLARRSPPDCAIDKHTRRGKSLGRGIEHFIDEGSKLENEVEGEFHADVKRRAETLMLKLWGKVNAGSKRTDPIDESDFDETPPKTGKAPATLFDE